MPIDTERNLPEPWNVATVLMMIMGFVVLTYITWHTCHTAVFLRHATRVTGVIIDPAGHPTIRFSTANGVQVEFVQNGFISRPRGAAVPVAYDPRNPAMTAQAATFWANWGESLWSLPMGLGFTLLPLFGVRAQFRPGR
ncbi:Protein of unknown function [Paraburkholderia phenazinium]|uniref:DUF3592 domain-containing protein n=1 Tax=Paraburkholderia phenazinium TaxID=60549 RepID=A0A1G7RF85_9BURK|nr:Protein of unknown function [Paraburkholderia phenazinium]